MTKNLIESDEIQYIADVHPQILFCRNSAVVKVTRGKGVFHEIYNTDEWSQLCLENQPLYTSCVDNTGSYQDIIRLGYGEGSGANEVMQESIAQVNGPYTKLKMAIDAIHPLLNLLESGTYLIGDFDLFPVQKCGKGKPECFWNLPKRNGCYWPYSELAEWTPSGYEMNKHPLYLVPTQRAKLMNSKSVLSYMKWLDEDSQSVPRAIGLYLRGSAVLLLDGHHKALAAAAMGVPVKTLVIFKLKDGKSLLEATEQGKRLFLRRKPLELVVCDHEETVCSSWTWFGENRKVTTSRNIAFDEPDTETWGYIDEQWIAEMKNPNMMNARILRDGTELSCNMIKELISRLQKMPISELEKSKNSELVHKLRSYVALDPENKWITSAQCQWLIDPAGTGKYCFEGKYQNDKQ